MQANVKSSVNPYQDFSYFLALLQADVYCLSSVGIFILIFLTQQAYFYRTCYAGTVYAVVINVCVCACLAVTL